MPSPEAEYAQAASSSHRKSLGQYFTHPRIARFMTQWIMESNNSDIYDPCFGLGAFLKALPRDSGMTLTASEADSRILTFWQSSTNHGPIEIRQEDYLSTWGRRHGNIICNPPYLRFQKFPNRTKIIEEFERRLNLKLSGYTNTASAFLIKSLSELAPGGRLAYIMPLEFLNTGYGEVVKNKLLAERRLVAIIRLECEREAFPDAITSLGILLYDKGAQYPEVKFYTAKSIQELDSLMDYGTGECIPCDQLSARDKWLPYFDSTRATPDYANIVPLSFYGRFSRGIATGANKFFVLRPSQARKLGLEADELVPVITRSQQVQTACFTTEDYTNLTNADAPALLFHANANPSPSARHYIQTGEHQDFHQRYITRHRKPWYKNEIRQPAPILFGVFSRGGYKVVRNTSQVLHLTCFHGFQPNQSGQHYLDHLFLYLHSIPGRDLVTLSLRKYGNSLDKFEPNDLNKASAPAPGVLDAIPSKAVKSAMQELQATGRTPAGVNEWFANLAQ